MQVDLLDRLVIIRTLPYSLEEAVQILAIRAEVRSGRCLAPARASCLAVGCNVCSSQSISAWLSQGHDREFQRERGLVDVDRSRHQSVLNSR